MHGLASSSPPLRLPPSSSWLVPSPSSLNRRRTLPLLGALLCFFALLHAVVEVPDEPAARLRQLFSLEPAVPKATLGADLSFTQYLDAHWPLERRTQQPHLWITLADGLFARTGAANLDAFVRQLNLERRRKYGRKTRETHLVTLCLDEPCVVECAQRDMYAYGGFPRQKPEQILNATWPKLASLIEGLPHRDLFFVDADVSFAQDPYPHMEPLMENYDLLAQENDAFGYFNTGWMWMRKG